MATLVATPDPSTGTVLVDVEQTLMRDLFTRVTANGWGTATTGQIWSISGGVAGNYATTGTTGTHTMTTTNASRLSYTLTAAAGDDMMVSSQITVAVAALTQAIQVGVAARVSSSSNYYFAVISIEPTGVVTLQLRKFVLSVATTISSVVLNQVHVAGATWNVTLAVCGTELSAKAWRSTVTEPGWLLTAPDFDLPTGTGVGARSFLVTGNTNVNPVISYDNLWVGVGQPVRLYRVLDDDSRTEVRGSPFYTFPVTAAALTGIATIWDNEAPFDTAYTYELFSDCEMETSEAVSNTVTLLSNGNGWVRSPTEPHLNFVLTEDGVAYNDCNNDNVVTFLGWDPRVLANGSGIFSVVNSERPTTVSMRRKRYESQFYFATKTLDDMDMFEEIFLPGAVLLVSLPAAYGFGRPYNQDYITVMDLEQGNADTNDFRVPFRLWTVPFQLSYAPPDLNEGMTGSNGIGGGGATYMDISNSALGASYATTTASGETYQQLAQGVGY